MSLTISQYEEILKNPHLRSDQWKYFEHKRCILQEMQKPLDTITICGIRHPVPPRKEDWYSYGGRTYR